VELQIRVRVINIIPEIRISSVLLIRECVHFDVRLEILNIGFLLFFAHRLAIISTVAVCRIRAGNSKKPITK